MADDKIQSRPVGGEPAVAGDGVTGHKAAAAERNGAAAPAAPEAEALIRLNYRNGFGL